MDIEIITIVLPRIYDTLYKVLEKDNDTKRALTIIKDNMNREELFNNLLGIGFKYCAEKNNHKFLQKIIENIPGILENNEISETMIKILCESSSYKCLKVLSGKGFNFHDSALIFASMNDDNNWPKKKKVIDFLLSQNCNKDYCNNKGYTPLIASIFQQDFSCVKYLLSKGCDPNIMSNKSTLMIAALKANKRIFQLLLDNNANIFLKDDYGNNIAHYTTKFNIMFFYEKNYIQKKIKFAKYMKKNNFLINDKNNLGFDYRETYCHFIDEIKNLNLMNHEIYCFSNIIDNNDNLHFSDLNVSQNVVITNETEFIDQDYLTIHGNKDLSYYFYDVRDVTENKIIRLFDYKIFSDIISRKVKCNPYTLKLWPINDLKCLLWRVSDKKAFYHYKNKDYLIHVGSKGGKYIMGDNNKKIYIKS